MVLRKTNNSHDASHRKSMPAAVSFVDHNLLSEARPASAIHFTHKFYQTQERDDTLQRPVTRNDNQKRHPWKSTKPVHIETAFVGDNSLVTCREGKVHAEDKVHTEVNDHKISYIDTSTTVVAPKATRPNLGRHSLSSEFTGGDNAKVETSEGRSEFNSEGHRSPVCDSRSTEADISGSENRPEREVYITPGAQYRVSVSATGVNGTLTVSRSTLSASSSESPEWPSPPEPLTPMTPLTPDCHVEFDSDVLKRMLQSLPVSPEDPSTMDTRLHDDASVSPKSKKSGLARAKSLNTHDRVKKQKNEGSKKTDSSRQSSFFNNNNNSRSRQTRLLVEQELRLRDKCVRDSYGTESYPDSGIGGMSVENAGSVWSGNSKSSNQLSGYI